MTGQNDLTELTTGWSEVVVKMLRLKIARLQIRETGSLYDSLDATVTGAGFGMQALFSYNLYGKFVDMGVGRNFKKGNSGDINSKNKQRRRKEWFSRLFYAQVMTLSELVKKEMGEKAAKRIVGIIKPVADLKYAEYRSKDLARNAKNYQKQINLPIEERSWAKTK